MAALYIPVRHFKLRKKACMANSVYFNPRQLGALKRIGDVLLPAGGDFPAFSHTGALAHIDEMMAPAHPDDIRDLKTVLLLLSLMPTPVLAFLLRRCMAAHGQNHWLSVPLRQLDIGLRGIVYSLYYANQCGEDGQGTVFAAMDYQLHCTADY